ncbi:MAG: hypothetical protein ABI357_07805, partial [Granulicella sp.]
GAPAPVPAATGKTHVSVPSPRAVPSAHPASPVVAGKPATLMPATGPLVVSGVTVGRTIDADYRVTQVSRKFTSDDRVIYASVATTGNSRGAMLNARWSYLEGDGQLVSSVSQSIATGRPAVTAFEVRNPDRWPAGRYKVDISLDGTVVASQPFEIAAP